MVTKQIPVLMFGLISLCAGHVVPSEGHKRAGEILQPHPLVDEIVVDDWNDDKVGPSCHYIYMYIVIIW